MEITLENIYKYYGPVAANRNISFTIHSHSIHGILGENGAGKSTLMKILAGFTPKSRGRILLNGEEIEYNSPAEATALGIGMLYQDPQDFLSMSVLENFILGLSSSWHINTHYYRKLFKDTTRKLGFDISPEIPVSMLTVGERQQLEIIRLIAIGVEVLILDEPTTGISARQKEKLFEALRQLAKEGKSIVMVSHKLEDVQMLCDRVTVLREGEVAGEMEAPFNTSALLSMMFGHKVSHRPFTPEGTHSGQELVKGKPVLEFREVSALEGRSGLRGCSFKIRAGEIVGLAGLEGSGQEVFLRLAAGIYSPIKGDIYFQEKRITEKKHSYLRSQGICFVPASRIEQGLFPDLTLKEHFAIAFHGKSFFTPWKAVMDTTEEKIREFRIKGTPYYSASSLSGGNQQRLLLSLIPQTTKLLLLEQPTRGLDMESALWVWEHLREYSRGNRALIFSSAELDEIFSVAHRIVVFFNGQIILNEPKGKTSMEEVSRAIAGIKEEKMSLSYKYRGEDPIDERS